MRHFSALAISGISYLPSLFREWLKIRGGKAGSSWKSSRYEQIPQKIFACGADFEGCNRMKMGSRSRTGLGTVGSLALIIPAHLWRSMTSLRLVYEWLCNTKEESQIPVRGCAPECSIWEAGCGFSIILYTDSAAGEKKFGVSLYNKGKD